MELIGFHLGGLARELHRLMNENLRKKGLSSAQIRLLGYLDRKEELGESCIQEDIRQLCNIRSSSVTGLIQTLEQQGYIVRETGEDARSKRVVLTSSGRDVARECKSFIDRVEERLTDGFTEEEERQFSDYLARATQNLDRLAKEFKE